MRYTTVIDLTDIRAVYNNKHAVLLYYHLAMKCGYHDNDRDMIAISIRKLAADLDMTLSATRHALKILENYSLLRHEGSVYRVRKYIIEQPATPRARSQKKAKEQEIRAYEEQQQRERQQREAEARKRVRAERAANGGKTPMQAMFEEYERRAAAGDLEAQQKLNYWKQYQKK